ncbi:hypothetical protein [Nocardia cyriacigeorgica]|nr:hypothetical protein [Nocardia cyriacigeorgica]
MGAGWYDVLDDHLCACAGFTRTVLAAAVRETARTVLTTGTLPPWRTR